MLKAAAKIIIAFLLLIACFFGFIDARDRWREDHIQANKAKITIGMSEAEVIAILGEPTSKHLSDIPRLYCLPSTVDESRQSNYNNRRRCRNFLLF